MYTISQLAPYANQLIQLLYIGAISSVLLAKSVPTLNQLLKYGKTLETSRDQHPATKRTALQLLLNAHVPKSWFTHFYIVSALLSGTQLFILAREYRDSISEGTSSSTVCVALVFAHSLRRCCECLWISKFGASQMHVSHYLVGLFFYTSVNCHVLFADRMPLTLSRVQLFGLGLFLVASADQLRNHYHLAQLVKYTVPSRGTFQWCTCAHYLDEIALYVAFNCVMEWKVPGFVLSLAWVVINLGVSAVETRNWYIQKGFQVQRWAIIPFVV